ncbi:MAG: isoprenylcysteine carboxylmethyltransferase family protein [Alphaproteobacteria bacterium]|nr:isoprenylcysteine carboxylmethyltransferase family protein [Alphaproteobacteria bacterium]
MHRFWALFGSVLFFIIAPGTVTLLVPWWITHLRYVPLAKEFSLPWWAGIALVAAGAVPLIDSFARFAWQGRGTPAPIAPPTRLVVTGFYRHVRNPIYVGLLIILAGETLLLARPGVLIWAAIFWLGCHVFVSSYEEPTLAERFGREYEIYRANVPRWIPRLTPWHLP